MTLKELATVKILATSRNACGWLMNSFGRCRHWMCSPVSTRLPRPCSCSAPGPWHRAFTDRSRCFRCGGGDLRPPRRHPVGGRVCRLSLAVDDVAELRDRLDDRFRLLVGSRRGLKRHHLLLNAA